MDTIFAVSSGAPPAAIAVLRVSGPAAFAAARALAGPLPPPRRAALRALADPETGQPLDRALLLCFPGPGTATGEDIVEFHLHGGRAVMRAVETALAGMPGLRPAEPGEFTRRALHNGRIDLSEAEGLADLLAAETESQRRAALLSAEGAVRRRVGDWSARVLALSAEVEALLDHGDEGDVVAEARSLDRLREACVALAGEIAVLVAQPPVERLRDGIRIVLAGPPNAGKSTLFNALAEREAAIVSAIAGTTRDRIESPVQREGIAYLLVDTAGLAEATRDPIEAIGIGRAQEAVASADILLWLGDAQPPAHPRTIVLHARADAEGREEAPAGRILISAATGAGIDMLWTRIGAIARTLLPPPDSVALNARQRLLAGQAADALRAIEGECDELLIAEHLRAARRAFDRITGRADVEAMLDALFSRFCIGK